MDHISIIRADVESVSPLFISDGEDILLDKSTGMAHIPATTIAGAFRAYLDFMDEDSSILFGDGGNLGTKSSIYIRDAYGCTQGFERRDGVRIDGKTGSSQVGGKIDRFYLQKGTRFLFEFKIESDAEGIGKKKELLYKALQGLDRSFIRIGGNKSNGLGIFKVLELREANFDFSTKRDWLAYIRQDYDLENIKNRVLKDEANHKFVEFKMKGSLSTPLLIGAPESYNPDEPDNVSMSSGKDYIIPGSSFKGVLRSRIESIGNYFGMSQAAQMMFGSGNDRNYMSRVLVEEAVIDTKAWIKNHYNRIKIDRFTGGVRDTGLMNDMPVQGPVNFKILYKTQGNEQLDSYAIGILALALRDLGMENISLGGGTSIGRGRYRADTLEINLGGEAIKVDFKKRHIINEDMLNRYIRHVKIQGKGEDRHE